MAHTHQLSSREIEALWEATQHLTDEVALLQSRLAQYEDGAHDARHDALTDVDGADVWNVWPYRQALDFYRHCTSRFHSFHEKLFVWRGASHNRRAQAACGRGGHEGGVRLELI